MHQCKMANVKLLYQCVNASMNQYLAGSLPARLAVVEGSGAVFVCDVLLDEPELNSRACEAVSFS